MEVVKHRYPKKPRKEFDIILVREKKTNEITK